MECPRASFLTTCCEPATEVECIIVGLHVNNDYHVIAHPATKNKSLLVVNCQGLDRRFESADVWVCVGEQSLSIDRGKESDGEVVRLDVHCSGIEKVRMTIRIATRIAIRVATRVTTAWTTGLSNWCAPTSKKCW